MNFASAIGAILTRYGLVTGSGGLIGSESVHRLIAEGFVVYGIDNDMRSYFFGPDASTKWNQNNLINNAFVDGNNYLTYEIVFCI